MGRTTQRIVLSEAALVDKLSQHIHLLLKCKGSEWLIGREVGVGRSIADVVAIRSKCRRKTLVPTALTISESVVLSSLRIHGSTRIDLLEKRCGLPRGGLRDGMLDRLRNWRLVRMREGGGITLSASWANATRIIAFEAKLKKWRVALEQAKAYLRYADEAYVVLPEKLAGPAVDSIEMFETAGIGLLLIDQSGITVKLKAKPSANHDWRREFVRSRMSDSTTRQVC